MKSIDNFDEFMKKTSENLEIMLKNLVNLPEIKLEELTKNKTALFIVDMVNGFAKEGSLYSDNVNSLIPGIVKLAKKSKEAGISIYAYVDRHKGNSVELKSYPVHCLENSQESELIAELKEIGEITVFDKNSTNGFFGKHFLSTSDCSKSVNFNEYFSKNEIENFIIIGDCTDICVYQFAITLKAYFNEHNFDKRVIIPMDLVDTFDIEGHYADFMNVVFLNSMLANGIDVVKTITCP